MTLPSLNLFKNRSRIFGGTLGPLLRSVLRRVYTLLSSTRNRIPAHPLRFRYLPTSPDDLRLCRSNIEFRVHLNSTRAVILILAESSLRPPFYSGRRIHAILP